MPENPGQRRVRQRQVAHLLAGRGEDGVQHLRRRHETAWACYFAQPKVCRYATMLARSAALGTEMAMVVPRTIAVGLAR